MSKIIKTAITLICGIFSGLFIALAINSKPVSVETNSPEEVVTEIHIDAGSLELSEEQKPALLYNDQGELVEENYPTLEEVDGGRFEEAPLFVNQEDVEQFVGLGWSESYPTTTPEDFKKTTLGNCIVANNYYGAQCVSLARVFWWSYANRDISTCGTGMAKGMMDCSEELAGDDFEILRQEDKNNIQSGDWLIFSGGLYGHIGMALGPVQNGYVALLGENQGGASCGEGIGGSATNIINLSMKNFLGGYRPKSYIKQEVLTLPETSHGSTSN